MALKKKPKKIQSPKVSFDPEVLPTEKSVHFGNRIERSVISDISKIFDISATFGSGSVFGDQDAVITLGPLKIHLSIKGKKKTPKGSYPTLPYSEVLEPVRFCQDKNLTPLTVVSWETNGIQDPYVVIRQDDFIRLVKALKHD